MSLQLAGGSWHLAPALATLAGQLRVAWPGQGWVNSPQTGTVGDLRHAAEGWTGSDHNPFVAPSGSVLPAGQAGGLVRALDVAANVSGVTGIVTVTDAPNCEALFGMVNQMYRDEDPRVFPDGYGIYLRRITDWNHPGAYKQQIGDPHLYHLHISLSRRPAGFNSTAPWPLPGRPAPSKDWFVMATLADLKTAVSQTPVNLAAATQVEIRRAAARASGPMFVNFADAPAAIRPAIYQVTDAGLRFIPGTEFGEITARWGGPPYVVTSTTKSIWWRLPIVPGTFDPRK